MGAIKVANYQAIANYYAAGFDQVTDVSDNYLQAAEEVVLLQAFDPELDLLSPFYNAYLSSRAVYNNTPASILSAVRVLQEHVLARARTGGNNPFTDINDWIDSGDTNGVLAGGDGLGGNPVGRLDDVDTSFKVPAAFATMSTQAGFAIETGNIV